MEKKKEAWRKIEFVRDGEDDMKTYQQKTASVH